MDLLDASNTSALVGVKCPKCGEEKLARVTELKDVSDNLVLHINRVSNGGNGNKLQTPVELPLKPITVCGKEFVLNAVVRHKGYTVNGGHYTILRRRSPEWVTDDKSLWSQEELLHSVAVSLLISKTLFSVTALSAS